MKQRVYRTGDVGRALPNGDVEICGRLDFQVKIQKRVAICISVVERSNVLAKVTLAFQNTFDRHKASTPFSTTLKYQRNSESIYRR